MTLHSDAVDLLIQARQGTRLAALPPALEPATLEAAYAIQTDVMAKLGGVAGWKIAPTKDGSAPLTSPVPPSAIHVSPAKLASAEVPGAEIEVEIAIRFGRDLPPRDAPYVRQDIVDAIASVHPAFEVLSSRFLDRQTVPPMVAIADCQSNGAVVVGPALTDWQGLDFSTVAMKLRFDGAEVGSAAGGIATGHVLDALTWLANHAQTRGLSLKAGDTVITGARVGPVLASAPLEIEADVAGIGTVALTLV